MSAPGGLAQRVPVHVERGRKQQPGRVRLAETGRHDIAGTLDVDLAGLLGPILAARRDDRGEMHHHIDPDRRLGHRGGIPDIPPDDPGARRQATRPAPVAHTVPGKAAHTVTLANELRQRV
jgi:hypothetical protein